MPDFEGFLEFFSILPDLRIDRTRKYLLTDILFVGVRSTLCGGEGFTDMEDFAIDNEEWLRRYLELPGGIPSHDKVRRVFSILDAKFFSECFSRWSQHLHEVTGGEVIALDGKTIRHSFDKVSNQPALHIVSAWALGHVTVDSKENEIRVLPDLLKMLAIKGRAIIMDAMGCQKKLAEQIIANKGDYVLCVKGNHETLHNGLKGVCQANCASAISRLYQCHTHELQYYVSLAARRSLCTYQIRYALLLYLYLFQA